MSSAGSREGRDPGRHGGDPGQATVEFALVVPLVGLLLLAIVQVGLTVRTDVMVTHAAREAARVAAVGGSDTAVRHAAVGAGGLAPELVEVDVERSDTRVTVVIRYREPVVVPLVATLVDGVDHAAEATMRREDT